MLKLRKVKYNHILKGRKASKVSYMRVRSTAMQILNTKFNQRLNKKPETQQETRDSTRNQRLNKKPITYFFLISVLMTACQTSNHFLDAFSEV
ncbi:hypothetical protein EMCRGX_G023552 [Ephydatia muelleri]